MKISYITAQTPWSRAENFILDELLEIKRLGINLLIIPRNPQKKIFHKEAENLIENSIWLPLINGKIIINFFYSLSTNPYLWRVIRNIFKYSRNFHILIKNLSVLPKGVYISSILKKNKVEHIHVHWGGTTATIGYIISQLTSIPWSLSLHRWDIRQNNMLKEKVKSAKFVRCISEHGKNILLQIVSEKYKEKINIIHLGIRPPNLSGFKEKRKVPKKFIIVTPALFLEVKGHEYLIRACRILVKHNIKNLLFIFYGEGPLRNKLTKLIKEKRLSNYIKMPGVISHEKLMEMYKRKEVDLVVLPSINTDKGSHEGIPVSLMEAMAFRIPVISTNTGGIPELLSYGAGIMVKEKSPEQLAEAIKNLLENFDVQNQITEIGRQRIKEQFNIFVTVPTILEKMQINL